MPNLKLNWNDLVYSNHPYGYNNISYPPQKYAASIGTCKVTASSKGVEITDMSAWGNGSIHLNPGDAVYLTEFIADALGVKNSYGSGSSLPPQKYVVNPDVPKKTYWGKQAFEKPLTVQAEPKEEEDGFPGGVTLFRGSQKIMLSLPELRKALAIAEMEGLK